jgi:phage tail sheath protein FI
MGEYKSPGVYVDEVPSSIKAIAGVSTSTAAFIGVVPDDINLVARDVPDSEGKPKWKYVKFKLLAAEKEPKLITNWTQFTKQFGDFLGDSSETGVTGTGVAIDEGHRNLAHAVYGFFNNGGSRCFVTRIKADTDLDEALRALAAIDEVALVAAPGMIDAASRTSLVVHCSNTKDRFAIFDGPAAVDNLDKLTKTSAEGTATTAGLAPTNTDLAAWYFPWVKVFDPAEKLQAPAGDGSINVPPSGHIAGIYARVDTNRGVFKAPANEPILGALGVSQPISKPDQDGLNLQGVNCIRVLNGNIFVWGARTVGGDANADLKYINVRRTLLFLRESIDEGMQWAVFEPNTPALWQKITRNITAFLTNVWRSGALFGNTAAEAFYVKCDAETNPPDLREQGQVVTEIGVAIARPAEFVIFRISQFAGTSK